MCLRLDPQDNSEVHFKVKMTTKFEKVRVRRAPDPDRVLYPSTPRPSETTAEHVADRRTWPLALPSRQIFNAFCSRKALQPDAVRFLFDGSRINPNQTPKDVRCATRPAASLPRALPHANQISRGVTNLGAQKRQRRGENTVSSSGPIDPRFAKI